ncbi:Peptidase S8, subtilisin-related like protein [Aduncisulcus paluster]|uniref:Peptidase S8, subtilisin-related like protein n=1 Tax=Aduncisulcus paluster TaxID=2918883 RepID=A0ABQ5K760_9EUKA|nr:Peptidase S8, subtilisin-related like protein [Aduncisulcus paluster]
MISLKTLQIAFPYIFYIYFHVLWFSSYILSSFAYNNDPNIKLNDSLEEYQWYLGSDNYGVRVRDLWEENIYGSGITIAVIDSGIIDCDDLTVDPSLEYVTVTIDDSDGTSFSHGTSCAEIIGGMNSNDIGFTGISPQSIISNIGVIDSNTTSSTISSAFLIHYSDIDITNSSWSQYVCTASSCLMYEDIEDLESSLDTLHSKGREGKGIVTVFASGNYGSFGGHCNMNATSLPYALFINAHTHLGTAASYGNVGSCIFVSAPSGTYTEVDTEDISIQFNYLHDTFHGERGNYFDMVSNSKSIQPNASSTSYSFNMKEPLSLFDVYTNDIHGGSIIDSSQSFKVHSDDSYVSSMPGVLKNGTYTFGFNGTSAATPVASGVFSLLFSSHPTLTMREAMHCVANGAEMIDSTDSHWQLNSGGYWRSSVYGFGALNASTAFQCVENIATSSDSLVMPPFQKCADTDGHPDFPIIVRGLRKESFHLEFHTDGVVEFLGLWIDISGDEYSIMNTTIRVVSPSGTVSLLVPKRIQQTSITFESSLTSLDFFGENMRGEWIVETWVHVGHAEISLSEIQLCLYGQETLGILSSSFDMNDIISDETDVVISWDFTSDEFYVDSKDSSSSLSISSVANDLFDVYIVQNNFPFFMVRPPLTQLLFTGVFEQGRMSFEGRELANTISSGSNMANGGCDCGYGRRIIVVNRNNIQVSSPSLPFTLSLSSCILEERPGQALPYSIGYNTYIVISGILMVVLPPFLILLCCDVCSLSTKMNKHPLKSISRTLHPDIVQLAKQLKENTCCFGCGANRREIILPDEESDELMLNIRSNIQTSSELPDSIKPQPIASPTVLKQEEEDDSSCQQTERSENDGVITIQLSVPVLPAISPESDIPPKKVTICSDETLLSCEKKKEEEQHQSQPQSSIAQLDIPLNLIDFDTLAIEKELVTRYIHQIQQSLLSASDEVTDLSCKQDRTIVSSSCDRSVDWISMKSHLQHFQQYLQSLSLGPSYYTIESISSVGLSVGICLLSNNAFDESYQIFCVVLTLIKRWKDKARDDSKEKETSLSSDEITLEHSHIFSSEPSKSFSLTASILETVCERARFGAFFSVGLSVGICLLSNNAFDESYQIFCVVLTLIKRWKDKARDDSKEKETSLSSDEITLEHSHIFSSEPSKSFSLTASILETVCERARFGAFLSSLLYDGELELGCMKSESVGGETGLIAVDIATSFAENDEEGLHRIQADPSLHVIVGEPLAAIIKALTL